MTWDPHPEKDQHTARLGHLGCLIVRRVRTNYEVVVFGTPLKERSDTVEEGKLRAEAAARHWIELAKKRMSDA